MRDKIVRVHFHSQIESYFSLNLWQWQDNELGREASFKRYDSFGAVARLHYLVEDDQNTVYVKAKTPNWLYQTAEYQVNLEYGLALTEVWLVDGDPTVYYSRQAAVASPHYGRHQRHAYDMAVNHERFDAKWGFSGWLGAKYAEQATEFRLWAPTAERVELILYASADNKASVEKVLPMERGQVEDQADHSQNTQGVWFITVPGDQNYRSYRYRIYYRKRTFVHSRDPYSIATTADGRRSVVINPADLKPAGFSVGHGDQAPWRLDNPTQAVIMEMHIRDFSKSASSGVRAENRGKFLGAIETGTKNHFGDKTGFDYVKELGVNYIQLQPIFDHHQTLDDQGNYAYNWGYDPENFNVPEASFASQPANPANRILELKKVIQAYHDAGIGVIMDVVYNHTYSNRDSAFQLTVPDYYYRMTPDGTFQNGSGCGNETASEKEMFRKYMIDSILYWVQEYNIDGFRFDLLGLHDVDTMNAIRAAVDAIDPRIILYGEGWDMGTGLMPEQKAKKGNAQLMPGIGFFNDDQRDAVKGAEVYGDFKLGFVSGAATEDVLAKTVFASRELNTYASPSQVLNYIEAHDNYNLNDLFLHLHPEDDKETHRRRIELANALNLLVHGMTFMQLGQEFMRTKLYPTGKQGELTWADKERAMNSYNAPDEVNQVDWDLVTLNKPTVDLLKKLISFKKTERAFSANDFDLIQQMFYVEYSDNSSGILDFTIKGEKEYRVIANVSKNIYNIRMTNDKNYAILVTNSNRLQNDLVSLEHLSFAILENQN